MHVVRGIMGGAVLLALAAGCASTGDKCCAGRSFKPTMTMAPAESVMAQVKAPVKPTVSVGSEFDKPGFKTVVKEGRLWVFANDSEALAAYMASGKTPADHVTRVKAGPEGMTVKSDDGDVIVSYLVSKPGFKTIVKEGRLWVFANDSEALAAYMASGKTPADHVTRVKAGPLGMTIKAADSETIVDYMVSKPGFETVVKDGRIWVFAKGSEGCKAYMASGKTPADHVTRVKAGPLGMTVKSDDGAVIEAYLK